MVLLKNQRKALTISVAMAYWLAYRKTLGAVGNVPYRKPYILSEIVSFLTPPECRALTTSHVIRGSKILQTERILVD